MLNQMGLVHHVGVANEKEGRLPSLHTAHFGDDIALRDAEISFLRRQLAQEQSARREAVGRVERGRQRLLALHREIAGAGIDFGATLDLLMVVVEATMRHLESPFGAVWVRDADTEWCLAYARDEKGRVFGVTKPAAGSTETDANCGLLSIPANEDAATLALLARSRGLGRMGFLRVCDSEGNPVAIFEFYHGASHWTESGLFADEGTMQFIRKTVSAGMSRERCPELLVGWAHGSASFRHVGGCGRLHDEALRGILAALGEVVFEADLAGRIGFLNDCWETVTGHSAADSIGQSLVDLLAAGEPGLAAHLWRRLVHKSDPDKSHRLPIRQADGNHRLIELSVWRRIDAATQKEYVVGIIRKVATQEDGFVCHRQADEALHS